MRNACLRLLLVVCLAVAFGPSLGARQDWIEVKSDHFTVMSNAGERTTRTLVWRLEQVRNVMVNLWSWAKADLSKPLRVITVKDEQSMRALAPEYWEKRDAIRPASVWTTGADQHFLAIRGDVDVESQGTVNPHITAYFAYINLVMSQSLSRDIPLWLSRGLSGVLSNTLVTDEQIILGAPIPYHLERLRDGTRLPLDRLLTITRASRDTTRGEALALFDAQAWAFVHFLMFGENGARAEKLNQFAALVSAGKDPAASFAEALGTTAALDLPFRMYIERRVYMARRIKIDVNVARERFPTRPMPPAESAGVRALFHTAMGRPAEARTAIAAARKADAAAVSSFEAEGLLLDSENKDDDARAALMQAVDGGSTNAYVHYRLASLIWRSDADRATLERIERLLLKATALNPRYAHAYSWLGEIRASLGIGEPLGLVMRGVSLEPNEAAHRICAAYVLARQKKFDEADQQARLGLQLADSDAERARVQDLIGWIAQARSVAERSTAAAAAAASSTASPGAAPSPGASPSPTATPAARCQSGDDRACAEVLPAALAACEKKVANACAFAAGVHEGGRGVPADRVRAMALYQQACDGGVVEACTQLGVLLAAGGKPDDLTRSREVLTKACEAKSTRACELVKSLPK